MWCPIGCQKFLTVFSYVFIPLRTFIDTSDSFYDICLFYLNLAVSCLLIPISGVYFGVLNFLYVFFINLYIFRFF